MGNGTCTVRLRAPVEVPAYAPAFSIESFTGFEGLYDWGPRALSPGVGEVYVISAGQDEYSIGRWTSYFSSQPIALHGGQSQVNRIPVLSLSHEGRVFLFSRPLEVELMGGDDGFIAEIPELEMVAYGENQTDAMGSLQELFAIQWDNLAQEPDDILTVDAIDLANRLRSVVRMELPAA